MLLTYKKPRRTLPRDNIEAPTILLRPRISPRGSILEPLIRRIRLPPRRLWLDTTVDPPVPAAAPLRSTLRPGGELIPVVVRRRRTVPVTLPREQPDERTPLRWPTSAVSRDGRTLRRPRRGGARPVPRFADAAFLLARPVVRRRPMPPSLPPLARNVIHAGWYGTIPVHVCDLSAELPFRVGVGAPFLGGFLLTSIEWASSHAIAVGFSTTYGTRYVYQLYAGRTLIGATSITGDRAITGQLLPSLYPQYLTLLAVDPADRGSDFGDQLPLQPYNRVKLRWKTVGMPADARWIEITAGTAPGGAVNLANVIALIPFDLNRFYEFTTDPLDGSGTWNFEIAHRDDKPPDGNRGPAAATAATIVAIPPDVALGSDGTRLAVSVAAGVATATFSY